MDEAQFCVSWDSYLGHVSKGFASLQQNAEFVDMTLAADGHLVKAHQNIVAIASPYLRAMLQSAPCRHPVIFLNNVSHEILGYILEYIYTGEVKVPIMIINKFVKTCKSLCINGIDTIAAFKSTPVKPPEPEPTVERIEKPSDNNFAAHITINPQEQNYSVELVPDKYGTNIINKSNNNHEVIMPQAPTATAVSVNTCNTDLTTENSQIVNNETTHVKGFDISNINDFVILKPNNNANTNMEIDQNKADKSVKILSDIIINPNDWQTKSSKPYMQLNTSIIENPVEIILNTDNWQSKPTQNSSNEELTATIKENLLQTQDWQINPIEISSDSELSTNLIAKPVNIPLRTEDWALKPDTTHTQKNKNTIEGPADSSVTTEYQAPNPDVFNMNLNKSIVYKNLKKIGTHMKLMNEVVKPAKITLNKVARLNMDKAPHYSISNRGSLQILLNRFLYNSHHNSTNGRKRRWRCVDYRKTQCKAYVDTDDEQIIAVSETHDHPNHDNQIRKKIKSNLIFTSFSSAVETINTLVSVKDP